MNFIKYIFIIGAITMFLLGCKQEHSPHKSNVEKVTEFTADLNYDIRPSQETEEMELQLVAPELAGIKDFYVQKSANNIVSFPCSNCHSIDLDQLKAETSYEPQKAHWDIEIVHAGETTMDCNTCHSESDLNKLNSITGAQLDFNESYKSCAQCHSTQYKEWQGGAHGKRVGGWVPPRIVKSCVECHNPHNPSIESRWPARLNIAKITEN